MKNVIAIIAALIVVGGVIGSYFYPQNEVKTVMLAGSPAGSTFNNAKFAGVVVSLQSTTTNGTSTSLLNSDASDRYVVAVRAACEGLGTSKSVGAGAGIAALSYSVATTSTANPSTPTYNFALASSTVMGTSTVNNLVSSSTILSASTTNAMVWAAGTNLTFWWNATNTAVCTEGVDYIGS